MGAASPAKPRPFLRHAPSGPLAWADVDSVNTSMADRTRRNTLPARRPGLEKATGDLRTASAEPAPILRSGSCPEGQVQGPLAGEAADGRNAWRHHRPWNLRSIPAYTTPRMLLARTH